MLSLSARTSAPYEPPRVVEKVAHHRDVLALGVRHLGDVHGTSSRIKRIEVRGRRIEEVTNASGDALRHEAEDQPADGPGALRIGCLRESATLVRVAHARRFAEGQPFGIQTREVIGSNTTIPAPSSKEAPSCAAGTVHAPMPPQTVSALLAGFK
jgi:hypothetical protein